MKTMKTMIDSQGNAIPLKYVKKYDRARDAAARKVLARFLKARKDLEKVVVESIADLDAVRAEAGAEDSVGGEKGNYQLRSFDGHVLVQIRQNYRITLDERVIRAKELMFEYASGIAGKVDGTDGEALMEIIRSAFEANRTGNLPYTKVLALLRLNINAPKWVEAKTLLTESIKPEKGKCYITCAVRPDAQHDHRPVRLDLADCWPSEGKEVSDEA